ncbi:hypothetical protein B0H10DRAFT_1787469 [Mycena sp. CBHHK59/15]|nr:hypothetical protein B0H10DRAFT_1787469 [Mycena sp. CBHHK59/15]
MPRITRNPDLDLCPDFAGPIFQVACDAIIATITNKTTAQVITDLTADWQKDGDGKKAVWDVQEDADRLVHDAAANTAWEDAARRQEELDAEAAAEKKEADKKKPKLNDFDSNRGVADAIPLRPGVYALLKLMKFEYTELWNFTREGCADAAMATAQPSVNEDVFAFAKVDDFVGLRPAISLLASKNVVKDIVLMWDQLSFAKNSMLYHMAKLGWSEKHITSLADFWYALEVHPQRTLLHGDRIVIAYQDKVCVKWHDSLKLDQGFNIMNINDNLMRRARNEIWDSLRAECLTQVSISFPLKLSTTNFVSPFLNNLISRYSPHYCTCLPQTTHHLPKLYTAYPNRTPLTCLPLIA